MKTFSNRNVLKSTKLFELVTEWVGSHFRYPTQKILLLLHVEDNLFSGASCSGPLSN
jgi:hypothetical protein